MHSVLLRIFLYIENLNILFLSLIKAPAWLTELIEHSTWRSVVYKLAEEFPDCLMLNFTIKVTLVCPAY